MQQAKAWHHPKTLQTWRCLSWRCRSVRCGRRSSRSWVWTAWGRSALTRRLWAPSVRLQRTRRGGSRQNKTASWSNRRRRKSARRSSCTKRCWECNPAIAERASAKSVKIFSLMNNIQNVVVVTSHTNPSVKNMADVSHNCVSVVYKCRALTVDSLWTWPYSCRHSRRLVFMICTLDCFFGVLQIMSRWKQRELTAKSWDSYVSKTSNYEILKVFIFNIGRCNRESSLLLQTVNTCDVFLAFLNRKWKRRGRSTLNHPDPNQSMKMLQFIIQRSVRNTQSIHMAEYCTARCNIIANVVIFCTGAVKKCTFLTINPLIVKKWNQLKCICSDMQKSVETCSLMIARAVFCCLFQHFVGQVMSVESTDAQGPAGAKLMLARAPIKTVGQDVAGPTTQDPEYFSTVSAKDWCLRRLWFNTSPLHHFILSNTKWILQTKLCSTLTFTYHEWLLISNGQFIPSIWDWSVIFDFGSKCRHEVTWWAQSALCTVAHLHPLI